MRLIDADALKKANELDTATKYGNKTVEQRDESYSTMMLYEIADMIDDAPTIDAEPVRHGHCYVDSVGYERCSVCNESEHGMRYFRFCPHCGAKIDMGDDAD